MTVAGIIISVKKITTKAGNHEMAFVKLEDLQGVIELVVFPKIYAKTVDLWFADTLIVAAGKVDQKDDRLVLLVDDAKRISTAY